MPPVVHHIEMCVGDGFKTFESLRSFGFHLHARRTTKSCQQWAVKVGKSVFVVTQRRTTEVSNPREDLTMLCCENRDAHTLDTVFNVAFRVKNVPELTKRISAQGGTVIQAPAQVRDKHGCVTYSIVRSCCGNLLHTLVNKDDYRGFFLPGFEPVRISGDCDELDDWDRRVTHVDHVTLACYPGDSQNVISWYEKSFGMKRFSINRDDDEEDGLVLGGGVGLRLKAMEYWKCAETGLSYPSTGTDQQRNPDGVMLVVVEPLPGQTNCNVETFLKEHEGPGVEHVALNTSQIVSTVSKMSALGVQFRQPPSAYYCHIKKSKQIHSIGEDIEALRKYGILLDSESQDSDDLKPRYLMQIFAHPLFCRKTFFLEIIQRCGATGLGAGNILALVRSIREEEAQKRKQQNGAAQLQERELQKQN